MDARLNASTLERFNDLWSLLFKQTERFARNEVNRYCWREASGGVLPDGYDANSIAAEAVAELFTEQKAKPSILNPQGLKKDLQKGVRRIVNRLHHRMENEVMISERDLAPIIHEDGEVVGALEALPRPSSSPSDELMRTEDAEDLEELQHRFTTFLGEDQLLKALFVCLCDGILKRAAIASRLKISCNAVKNAKKRLDRQVAEFSRLRNLKKV